jgi:hypothetical protein
MNRDQFSQWVADPSLLDQESLPFLQEIVSEYPYFQTARLLYLLNLKKLNDYRYDMELRRMAAFSGDRGRLRTLVTGAAGVMHEDDAITQLPDAPVPDDKEMERLKLLEDQINARLREIEEGQERLKQLMAEKEQLVSKATEEREPMAENEGKRGAFRSLPKDDLLEEFIRNRELAGTGQVTFFSPEESARRSIEENEGIISETLARLVAAQGKFERAIKIYEQLMLKNPQKSSYFAAQIEKLRKEL